ncbi:unnamed protein product [Staurois parvus]|uniref:Uncharacterized protein n=1 Tax=Staurois parvus TaxID=386267 RepID=A0ABN9BHC5_9NEOB|nr:unnamed protein product [Staurois parvus]
MWMERPAEGTLQRCN